MRGKAAHIVGEKFPTGITPAYAGKSFTQLESISREEDHPRLCGEKMPRERSGQLHQGSPPPMRGKGVSATDAKTKAGITPAYAGKSFPQLHKLHRKKDHPRLCGEKNNVLGDVREVSGSPPPMRGKVCIVRIYNRLVRITPAYAGKSFQAHSRPRRIQDHPRLCGEKIMFFLLFSFEQGSPPPMRGKDFRVQIVRGFCGITPAYAGKSSRLPFIPTSFQDHPRLCGEKLIAVLVLV